MPILEKIKDLDTEDALSKCQLVPVELPSVPGAELTINSSLVAVPVDAMQEVTPPDKDVQALIRSIIEAASGPNGKLDESPLPGFRAIHKDEVRQLFARLVYRNNDNAKPDSRNKRFSRTLAKAQLSNDVKEGSDGLLTASAFELLDLSNIVLDPEPDAGHGRTGHP